jgi:microcystin degradation protein MlrC
MRIAVGGLHVECCTYNPVKLSERDFVIWRGDEMLAKPYFDVLKPFDATYLPTFYARAVPGGPIARSTYENFKADFLGRLKAAIPLDGVYLAMHGAVYVEGMEDAEGDWLTASRDVVGPGCIIAVSYDMHGSLSQKIIDTIDIFSTYRTAPHIDVPETQTRSLKMLHRTLATGEKPLLLWVPVPVVLNGEQTSTVDEPAKTIYGSLPQIDAIDGIWDASLQIGYMWADEPRSTAAAVMTGTDAVVLQREGAKLGSLYWDARHRFDFGSPVGSIAQGVALAKASATHPVILADSGDNPTAGGVGDRADVLAELIARDMQNTIVAGITDLPATEAAYAAGVGATIHTKIGAALDPASGSVVVDGKVVFLLETDNAMERQAVVRVGGIDIVLASRRRPYHNIADFTQLGLDPHKAGTLVVKSGYLSPELAPIANPNFMMLSDGAVNQSHARLPRMRKLVPTFPFDPDISWSPRPVFSSRSAARMQA